MKTVYGGSAASEDLEKIVEDLFDKQRLWSGNIVPVAPSMQKHYRMLPARMGDVHKWTEFPIGR